MNLRQALAAIRAAHIPCRLVLANDPEMVDDEIEIMGRSNVTVQICATRDGLMFCASFGEELPDDDYQVTHGQMTRDPVAAAREAISLACAPIHH